MTSQEAILEWTNDGTGKLPVFFDGKRRLVDSFHDYIAWLGQRKRMAAASMAYASTVEAASYAMLGWLRHLESTRRDWRRPDDTVLQSYRDAALKEVLCSTRSKQDERLAKRTVNIKVQWIYRFYEWAQQHARLCENVIGPNQPLSSTITQATRKARKRRKREVDLEKFPLCFDGVSGSGGTQYFASASDKQRIAEWFSLGDDPFIVERNNIILELTDRVGWRAGTLTGLVIEDFGEKALERADENGATVTPAVQKLAYQNRFDVPATLVGRIQRYIAARSRWLAVNGWSERQAQHRIFLNGRTGQPLGHQAIVQLLGRVFRAIGVRSKIGAGHHSFRRKFADESTVDDLAARRGLGLSTAVADVMHATAMRLGQRSLASQAPYQRAVRDSTRSHEAHQTRTRLKDLEGALSERDATIAELRRQLEAEQSKPTRKKK